MIKFLIQNLILFTINLNLLSCSQSYTYLNDKFIPEEQEIGSLVCDIYKELEIQHQHYLQSSNEFTLLDDSKQFDSNSYFKLNSTTGRLVTNKKFDREHMCLNHMCSNTCELGVLGGGHLSSNKTANDLLSCRLSLKILVLPSFSILSLNVYIQDINDNRPYFKTSNLTHKVNENVPIGYRIPIEPAFDPDVGVNTIQSYELIDNERKFRLEQNLNESQLFLVVISNLDREIKSFYNLRIKASDRGAWNELESSLNMNIEILDTNDNNPVFEKEIYKFRIKENAPLDTLLGTVKATDLDFGLNGIISYKFAESSQKNKIVDNQQSSSIKYFDLNEKTGELRLKKQLDYEIENFFSLVIEARDLGEGSLPAFTKIQIEVIDVNDNRPEISVSFLNNLFKNESDLLNFKYDIYLPENTKENKFLAHVSIFDKDSGINSKFEWKVLVNKENINLNSSTSALKIIKLNNNSFTLNVASSKYLDYEMQDHLNVSIIAWDYGEPKLNESVYKFRIKLIDSNDNAPQFQTNSYDISIYENNEYNQKIFSVKALDEDKDSKNSQITYSIEEEGIRHILSIDQNGNIYAKVQFDREIKETYIFHVRAVDNGLPPLSSKVEVKLNILDLNDNKPVIRFSTPFIHELKNENLFLRIGQNLSKNLKLIDFSCIDMDKNENSEIEYFLQNGGDFFKMSKNGSLILNKNLNFTTRMNFDLIVGCKDLGTLPTSLSSSFNLKIELADKNEFCISRLKHLSNEKEFSMSKFVNRDELKFKQKNKIFEINFSLLLSNNRTDSHLNAKLLNHKEIFYLEIEKISNRNGQVYFRLEIFISPNLSAENLILGKYNLQVHLVDTQSPSCSLTEIYHILVGNNQIKKENLKSILNSLKSNLISNENKLNLEIKQTDHLSNRSASNYYSMINSNAEYVLLLILIFIIVLSTLFLAGISIFCIYSKYFKDYKFDKSQYNLNSQKFIKPYSQIQQSNGVENEYKEPLKIICKSRNESIKFFTPEESLLEIKRKKKNANKKNKSRFLDSHQSTLKSIRCHLGHESNNSDTSGTVEESNLNSSASSSCKDYDVCNISKESDLNDLTKRHRYQTINSSKIYSRDFYQSKQNSVRFSNSLHSQENMPAHTIEVNSSENELLSFKCHKKPIILQ